MRFNNNTNKWVLMGTALILVIHLTQLTINEQLNMI